MQNLILQSKFDNYELHLLSSMVPNHKAIILMIHGMEEYKERYEKFIKCLNEAGYSCVISDMRGHGRHLSKNELGYFSKRKPNKALLYDEETILEYLESNYPDSSLYLFAHSMGTIIARNFLQKHSKSFKKVMLCGAPVYNSAAPLGALIADIICVFKSKKKAKLLQNMALGPYSKAVENAKTKLDWLSVSTENVQNYWNDPFCGFGFKNNGYKAMLNLMKTMDKKIENKNLVPKLAFISGVYDPVTGFEKGLHKSIRRLNKAGYRDIENIVIDNARHEILNEDNAIETINKIIEFYNN